MSDALESSVQVSFSLRVGEGTLKARLEVPAGKTTLTQILPVIQNFESDVIHHITGEVAAAGHPVTCRAGCGACCRQLVPLSLFEAEALGEWFAGLPEEKQKEIETRFRNGLAWLKEAGVLDRLMQEEWGDEKAVMQLAEDYFHAGVPCPFLEEESCSIRPIRPLICREYLVISPAELCKDPAKNQVGPVRLPLKASTAFFKIGQRLTGNSRGWIPLIFLLVWMKRGMKIGEFFSGTGEEMLRLFMENLVTEPSAEGATAPHFIQGRITQKP